MASIVEDAAALVQGAAEVLPLPDSQSHAPPNQNDVESPEVPLRDIETYRGRLSPVAEVAPVDDSVSDSTDIFDSTPDAAYDKSCSDKHACAEHAYDSRTSYGLSKGAANCDTQKTTPEESDSISIKSEFTDDKNGIKGSEINHSTNPAASQVDNTFPETEAVGPTCKSEESIEEGSDKSAEYIEPDDLKCEFQIIKPTLTQSLTIHF